MMYLPPEILSPILCHQPKTVLKNARLICKAFEAVATPLLFKDIFIIPRYADMEKSTLLASRFGSYVKTLILSSEYFEPELTLGMFGRNIPDRRMAQTYHESYRRLEHEQEEVLKGEFFGRLCSILTGLSNLQKVTLTDRERKGQLCWCQQAYVDGHSRTFDPFQFEYYPGLKSLRPPPEHNCVTSLKCFRHYESSIWLQTLLALYTSGNTSIKTIVTDFCRSGITSGITIRAFCMTPRQRYCAAKVLPNLTSLHLHLEVNFRVDAGRELYKERVVAQILSEAINLTSLEIDLVNNIVQHEVENPYIPTTFEMILEGCKMPKLVTFGLGSFAFPEAGITTFLQHSQGIQHMSFNNVKITSGSWRNVFQSIKGSLALKTVKLKKLRGVSEELCMTRFDSKKHNPYPPIKRYLLGDDPSPFSGAVLELGNE